MSLETSCLRAIREEPDDDAPRLIYADWLEERGDPRGEYLRLWCRVLQDVRRLRELRSGIAPDWLRQVHRDWFFELDCGPVAQRLQGRVVALEQFEDLADEFRDFEWLVNDWLATEVRGAGDMKDTNVRSQGSHPRGYL